MSNLGTYRKITNAETGQINLQTACELLSISPTEMENVNGTKYFPATVKIVDQQGQVQEVTAIVYRANFDYGIETGKEYLLTIAPGDERGPLLHMSHLSPRVIGKRATADMFDFASTSVEFSA